MTESVAEESFQALEIEAENAPPVRRTVSPIGDSELFVGDTSGKLPPPPSPFPPVRKPDNFLQTMIERSTVNGPHQHYQLPPPPPQRSHYDLATASSPRISIARPVQSLRDGKVV